VGREGEEAVGGEGGKGEGEKKKGEKGSVRKPRQIRRVYIDGSHEWGRDGSGDCGRVAIEESGASKSASLSCLHVDCLHVACKQRQVTS